MAERDGAPLFLPRFGFARGGTACSVWCCFDFALRLLYARLLCLRSRGLFGGTFGGVGLLVL
jgi:hypothetical protein